MKNNKKWLQFLLGVLDVAVPVLLIVFTSFLVFSILAETFGKQLCEDISICYSVVVFLAGIIITLKIKVLDSRKEAKEFILFIIGALVNTLFLIVSFALYCSSDSNKAILILNATIWADFIIVMRNLYLVIRIYFENLRKTKHQSDLTNKLKQEDLFAYWIENKDKSKWVERALVDRSYKNVNHDLKDIETNSDLSTYGDAVLKLCLSEILFDKAEQLSKKREEYESDKFLVSVIAKHYELLSYIKTDGNDQNMKRDYLYDGRKKNNNPRKYIATAVEAMIGAIYKEIKDLTPIIELLENWKKF